jgi:nucleoside-diphosphate-sugar epimerase
MRVFITGATGYVGGAVARTLRERGHEVAALVRPSSESHDLRDRGVVIISGDLSSLRDLPLGDYDAVVHAAASAKDQPGNDRIALDALAAADVFFVYTSGVWVLGNGRADEESPVNPLPLVSWRPAHEQQALRSGRAAVLRPGCVYGGAQGLLAKWFVAAEQKQPLTMVGDGENHWAMVHLEDAADCYARLVEQRATGVFHAVDDTRSSINECAQAVAPGGEIEHAPNDGSPYAQALTVDQFVSSERTRRSLGWSPSRTFAGSVEEQWREWRSAQKVD